MSYQEKSKLASALIALYILYNYLSSVITASLSQSLTTELLFDFLITAVIWSAILEIVSQAILALINMKEADDGEDERDHAIKLRASNISYHVICGFVYIAIFFVWLSGAHPERMANPFILQGVPAIYSILNILLVGFLVAEISRFVSQIYYYRKGF